MNSILKKIIALAVSLLLFAYVGYQAYSAFYNPVRTVRAASTTVDDVIKADCFMLRSETVIPSNSSEGVIDYLCSDGESVSKSMEVADVYKTAQDAQNHRRLQSLNAQIAAYKQMGTYADAASVDITVIDSEIKNNFLKLSRIAGSGSVTDAGDTESQLISFLNEKQLATGKIKNFNSQIARLQQQADELQAQTGAKIGIVASPDAGYFVSGADGYENAFKTASVSDIKASDIDRLFSMQPKAPDNVIGKVITGYEWYIVCKISNNDALRLKVGKSMDVRFPLSSEGSVPVTVYAINKDSSGSALVLKCTNMTAGLAAMRRQSMELIVNDYTGVRVPDSCINIVNGVRGVYVRDGNMAQFKKLQIVYSASGYVISSAAAPDDDYLQVYDEIIENGDDLYDGKIIK